jgi:type I restriction enzyme, R subunit
MPTNTKEIGFEESIEQYLSEHNGYHIRRNTVYDTALVLDPELVLQFIQTSQADAWEKMVEKYGDGASDALLRRLDEEIGTRGLLEVLRKGIADRGIRFDLAYFQPASQMNPETIALYETNILSVMRQVKYSSTNENSIDMVLFLNGLPLFTIELKNQLTGQSVENAIRQYRSDRDSKEKLLSFKRCLVHFAVDTDLVYMTTKLDGHKTTFLPFNTGNHGAAGNPVNERGYKTAYMWEDVWTKETVMRLVGDFICLAVDEREDVNGKKKKIETLIFPRYHQLDTVRRLIADAYEYGSGKNYLIQHSAGSGKSNTIAWTAHHLASLHNNSNKSVFDSVVVVTDRRVLDKQLRDTIRQFEQMPGVVKPIEEGSAELKASLEHGEKIIITTLQKFPFIVSEVEQLPGKRFAVIIDEAHSSQSGESAKSLRATLSGKTDEEREKELQKAADEDGEEEESSEDYILKQMKARKAKVSNISFFAFTATPKQKTLEVFGTQSTLDGKYYPFSLYSMKQAIEERFIMDVLKNYTPFSVYFSLLKKIQDDPQYQKKQAQRLMMQYVERNKHAIEKKIDVIVQHFDRHIAKLVHGRAKAMIVTKSRLHAVQYKKALDAYIAEHNIPHKAMVAFSGTVFDGGLEYTESGMNGVPESRTAAEFKKDEYRFMIVAEKFQTGFDQPLLTAMYVDKILSGVSAVQTLSRLNRSCPGKDEVFVLDFVNDVDDIKEAFQPYYTTTILSEATDPNILHDLERDLLNFGLFTMDEVVDLVDQYIQNISPALLNTYIDGYVDRYLQCGIEEQNGFKEVVTDYIRKYGFVSQVADFEDSNLERLYIFCKFLKKKLPKNKEELPVEVLESIDMDSYKIVQKPTQSIVLDDDTGVIEPIESTSGKQFEDQTELLSSIIKEVNDKFGTEFTPGDRIILNAISQKMLENEAVSGAIQHNNRSAAKIKFDAVFDDELVGMVNNHFDLYKKLDKSVDAKEYVRSKIFNFVFRRVLDKK